MKRHHSLPQDGSSEGLAEWIRTKSVGQQTDTRKQMYTEDNIAVLATKSAKSSIEIDKLEDIKTSFMDSLNNGQASKDDETFSIPTTVGIKLLKEKRHEAGIEIERGYKEINTPIYCIPDPDNNNMCYFDTGGNLYDAYTVDMDSAQRAKYSSPLFQEGEKVPLATETIRDQIDEKEKAKSDNGNKSEGGTGDSSRDEKSDLEVDLPPPSDETVAGMSEEEKTIEYHRLTKKGDLSDTEIRDILYPTDKGEELFPGDSNFEEMSDSDEESIKDFGSDDKDKPY